MKTTTRNATLIISLTLSASFACASDPPEFEDEGASSSGESGETLEPGQDAEFRAADFPPPVDGFANPLSPTGFATQALDATDPYYDAQGWGSSGHCGEDWNYNTGGNSDYGKPVYATANGIVRNAAHYGSGWGNIVMIEHFIPGAGASSYRFVTSQYAHLANFDVSVGEVVSRGQKIGDIGDADGAYPAHLHFEMRWDESIGPTANNGYNCFSTSTGTFDPTEFIDSHRTWGPNFDPATDEEFCTPQSPCGPSEADCDSSIDCLAGASCAFNVGAKYGWSSSTDVCESACHSSSLGGWSFCSEACPCGIGEGDCDSNSECLGDFVCQDNVGAEYGMGNSVDVCVQCHGSSLGSATYCDSDCPCDVHEGDCDSDSDCASGLECVHDVGAEYGWPSSYDVCR